MDLRKLVIATMSWARDTDEEKLLRLALKELSSFGVPVFITDGGSPEAFINDVNKFEKFNLMPSAKEGLWPQVKNSLQRAYDSGSPFILHTEPDKYNFFKVLPQMLNAIELNEDTGVILATRSASGMASFPRFQQMTETTINKCCAELTGLDLDYTYGPFVLNRKVIPHLQALPDDIGWGWRSLRI